MEKINKNERWLPKWKFSIKIIIYVFENTAYISDCNDLSIVNFKILQNLKYLILDSLRIKKNIVEIQDNEALLKFREIKPCKYNYIDVSRGTHEVYGFIAQEVKEIIPHAVQQQSVPHYIPNLYKPALYNNSILLQYSVRPSFDPFASKAKLNLDFYF